MSNPRYSNAPVGPALLFAAALLACLVAGVPALAAVPTAPSNLTATAVSPIRIDLSWTDNSSDETGFKIQRQVKGESSFTEIASVGANVTDYADETATPGKKCSYRVAANNADGPSAFSNTAKAKPPKEKKAPAAPSSLAASVTASGSVALTWQDNSNNERGFNIQRESGGGSFSTIATDPPGSTTYLDASVEGSTSYTYQVSAFNAAGSAPSNQVSAQVPSRNFTLTLTPASPGPFTADGVSGTQVSIQVADDQGSPVPGLSLTATLFSGDDVRTAFAVSDQGGGAYETAKITALIAGTNSLAVSTGESRSQPLALTFNPGPPHHFWIANVDQPASARNLTAYGHFQLMLKDAQDNQIPATSASYTFTYDSQNVSLTSQRNDALDLYDVSVGLISPHGGSPNYWGEPVIQVNEGGSNTTQSVTLHFPYVSFIQYDTGVPDETGLTLYLVDPRTSAESSGPSLDNAWDLCLTLNSCPCCQNATVTDQPGDDCQASGSVSGDCIGINGTCETFHYGCTPLGDVTWVCTGVPPQIITGTITGTAVYSNLTAHIADLAVAVAVKAKKDLKLTIWIAPGVDYNVAAGQVQKAIDKYAGLTGQCCPNFNVTVTYKYLGQETWGKIDANGDGKLQEYNDMNHPTGEENEMLKSAVADGINVFYVPGMSDGSLGESFGSNSVVVNGSSATDTTLAHELGHNMGGLVDNEAGLPETNLMWQTKNDENRQGLTADQCAKIAANFP